ncbi:hypothetical protein WISP_111555 [Willisornis vidua]|uniref:Uncharacterized protein n=1 Tax=Willisornis vidua TaxID=1566151 RepID=A0ABQ9CVB2_9PASS|nr:hypothetical protein WISP_111555 [Willisornis vidua]
MMRKNAFFKVMGMKCVSTYSSGPNTHIFDTAFENAKDRNIAIKQSNIAVNQSRYDKNFIQIRRVYPINFPGLHKKEEDQKSFFEFLVLNKHLGEWGIDDQSLVLLNNVVLPLNEQTEGCLTQELQTTQVCNLTREAKRPPKEAMTFGKELQRPDSFVKYYENTPIRQICFNQA